MNPLKRNLCVLACFLISFSVFAGRTKTVNKEYYANGRLRSITVTVVTTPRYADLYNYYKKTSVSRTEFDSLAGRKTRESLRVTKLGRGGKPCYEIRYRQVIYDSKGKRMQFEKKNCDSKKSKLKEYTNGKVSYIRIQKHRRWLWW